MSARVLMPNEYPEHVRAKALAAFARIGTVSGACKAANVGRQTWYNWMEADEAFAAEAVRLAEDVTDDLEREAIRRAKKGSDTLIIFLLKSRRRLQYGDRQTITVVHPEVQTRLKEQARRFTNELPAEALQIVKAITDAVWV